ncbi:MAG: hypothetical protein Q4F96_03675 [Bacillota bacterium]|nr:hypothetical protein [Bacillota bacterium]
MVKVDGKFGVPYVAVLSVGIFNLIFCMFPFGFIIVLDVALLLASYVMVYLSAMILRHRIPEEEYIFRIPGGNGFLKVICIVPICVAIFAFFVNGSDYYAGGMIGILSGPVLYLIWRRMYGGLSRKDPEAFVKNPRTGLAVGDTRRISFLLLIVTIMNIAALFFEPWYEGWGTEDAWESGEYFDGILEAVSVDVIVGVITIVLWVMTIVCAIACIVVYLLSRKVEPSTEACRAAFRKSCEAISARHNKELEEMIVDEGIETAGAKATDK